MTKVKPKRIIIHPFIIFTIDKMTASTIVPVISNFLRVYQIVIPNRIKNGKYTPGIIMSLRRDGSI